MEMDIYVINYFSELTISGLKMGGYLPLSHDEFKLRLPYTGIVLFIHK